jgi:hypothetical protein
MSHINILGFLIISLCIFLLWVSANNEIVFWRGLNYRYVFCFIPARLMFYFRGFLPQGSMDCKNKWRFRRKGVLKWIDKERERIKKKEKGKQKIE